MPQRWLTLVLVALVAAAPSACGDDSPEDPERLSAAERALVNDARDAVDAYCRAVGAFARRAAGPPSEQVSVEALAAVDDLAELARAKPEAKLPDQRTLRQLMGDIAEDLEGSNCSGELVARLDQALASLPPKP